MFVAKTVRTDADLGPELVICLGEIEGDVRSGQQMVGERDTDREMTRHVLGCKLSNDPDVGGRARSIADWK